MAKKEAENIEIHLVQGQAPEHGVPEPGSTVFGDDDLSQEYMDRVEEESYQDQLSQIRALQEPSRAEQEKVVDESPGQPPFPGGEDPTDEMFFQNFVSNLETRTGINQLSQENEAVYDIRGLYNDEDRDKLLGIDPTDGKVHLSDKYKRPSHPTFTTESVHFRDQVSTPAGKRDEKSGEFIPAPGQLQKDERFIEKFSTGDGVSLEEARETGPFLSQRPEDPPPLGSSFFRTLGQIETARRATGTIAEGALRQFARNLQDLMSSGGKKLRAIEIGKTPDGKSFTFGQMVKTLTGDPKIDTELVEKLDLKDSPKTHLAVELAGMALSIGLLKSGGATPGTAGVFGFVTGTDPDESLANLFREMRPETKNAIVELLETDADDPAIEKMAKKLVGDGLLLEAGIAIFIKLVKTLKAGDLPGILSNEIGGVGKGVKDKAKARGKKTPEKESPKIEEPAPITEKQLGELPDAEIEGLLGPEFKARAKGFFEEADARSFYETAGVVDDLGRLSKNYGRINSDQELLQAIAAVRDEFSEEILSANPVTTLKEIAEAAKKKAKNLVSAEVAEASEAVKAATVTYNAARIVQVREAKNYKILEDLVQNGAGDDVVAMMERQFFVFGQISEQVQSLKKAIAVAQGSGRIVAEVDSTVGGQLYADRLAALRQDFPGAIKGRELAQKTSLLTSPEQLEMLARGGTRPGFFEFFMEYWINAILSGPQTHIVNGGGNGLKMVWTIPERLMSGAINKLFRGDHPDSVQMEEARELMYGAMGGIRDAFDFAWKFGSGRSTTAERAKLMQGMDTAISEGGRKSQIREPVITGANAGLKNGVVSKAIDWAGSTTRIPTAMLGIEDAAFKFILKRMERRALAFNKAKQAIDPRTGKQLSPEQMDLMINKILMDPDDIMVGAVQEFADYNTFQARLGKVGQNVSKLVRSAPFMRLGLPFHVTPTNIGKDILLSLPTGLLDGDAALRFSFKLNQDIKRGLSSGATGAERRAADLALGKISAGSMFGAFAVQMAADGRITGPWAKDPALKEAQRRAGFQANSFRYIDENTGKINYISFSRVEPHGSIFGLAATFAQFAGELSDDEGEQMAALLAMSVSEQMTSKTYLKGMAEIIHAVEDNRWNSYLTRLAGSMVPNFMAQTNRGIDPVMRESQGAFEKVLSRIWGFSDFLPARRNLWAEKVLYGPGIGEDTASAIISVLNPLWTSEEKPDPVNDEIIRNRTPVRMVGRSINGIPLDVWQRDFFIQATAGVPLEEGKEGGSIEPIVVNEFITVPKGLSLKKALEYVINTDSYKRMSGGHALSEKSLTILGIVSGYRKAGRAKTRLKFPKLEAAIQARKRLGPQSRLNSEPQRETPRESFERKQSAEPARGGNTAPGQFTIR